MTTPQNQESIIESVPKLIPETILELQDVYYSYPGTQQTVLQGLNLRIPQGKRCALIGQNGCGKSTLFLLANGLYQPQRGNICWRDQPLDYDYKSLMNLRQKVGLVFQNPDQQIVATTVTEDISYGLYNLELPEEEIKIRIDRCLEQLGLVELTHKPIHHLSLGQKKMVSLAGVMVLDPELLLLDEPTAYLDQLHTQQLLAALKKIHTQKTTILMATHDLNLVYRWADLVFVLHQGRLVLEGTPQEVFAQQQTLQELQLGMPIALEMLSEVAIALQATSPLMENQGSPPVWRQLHQRILDLFRYL